MKYQEVMDYIEQIKCFGIVPGLESIKELCRRLGDPQKKLSFVHIAGTNGKGSTLAYVSTIMKKAGYRVGRYISPTIFEYRERIQVNERMIAKTALCEGMELIKNTCNEMVADGFQHPTPFEVETALAFWYFEKKECELVVLETGMGGLLDSTNIIENTKVAVLASISMDHMQFLGKTLDQIATQKAGIIKEGCIAVSMNQEKIAMDVIERNTKEKGVELIIADSHEALNVRYGLRKQRFDYQEYKKVEISLAGCCQIDNAVLALEVIKALQKQGYEISEKAIREGFRETVWLGRFSVVSDKPLMIVDGAHNEDAAKKLAASIQTYLSGKRLIYIMGVLKDKEYEKVIALTKDYADQIITLTPPDNPRALSGLELAREVSKVHPMVTVAESVEDAVDIARAMAGKEDVIVTFGSLSFLGKLIQYVDHINDSKNK